MHNHRLGPISRVGEVNIIVSGCVLRALPRRGFDQSLGLVKISTTPISGIVFSETIGEFLAVVAGEILIILRLGEDVFVGCIGATF